MESPHELEGDLDAVSARAGGALSACPANVLALAPRRGGARGAQGDESDWRTRSDPLLADLATDGPRGRCCGIGSLLVAFIVDHILFLACMRHEAPSPPLSPAAEPGCPGCPGCPAAAAALSPPPPASPAVSFAMSTSMALARSTPSSPSLSISTSIETPSSSPLSEEPPPPS